MPLADLPQEIKDRLNVLDLDPLRDYHFAVQVNAQSPGSGSLSLSGYARSVMIGCTAVEQLGDTIETREVREGGHRGVRRFPRRSRNSAIRLVKALSLSRELMDWFDEVRYWTKGRPDYRRSMSIFMLDHLHTAAGEIEYEVWRWDLAGCFPTDWNGPALNSMSDKLAFESITIQNTGISAATGIFSGNVGETLSTLAS